jgi:hypothetical protein
VSTYLTDLAGFRASAATVLAGFTRVTDAHIDDETRTVPRPDYPALAFDLAGQLGALLNCLNRGAVFGRGALILSSAQAATVACALEDAEVFLRARALAWCDDCESSPAAVCQQHLDDLDTADKYRAVAAELAKEASR